MLKWSNFFFEHLKKTIRTIASHLKKKEIVNSRAKKVKKQRSDLAVFLIQTYYVYRHRTFFIILLPVDLSLASMTCMYIRVSPLVTDLRAHQIEGSHKLGEHLFSK